MSNFRKFDEVAALWIVMEDRGLNEEERQAFNRWLEQSNAHRVAYLRLNSLWSDADRLAMLKHTNVSPDVQRQWALPLRSSLWVATVVACAILIGVFIPRPQHEVDVDRIMTGIGQSRVIKLADGTRVQLNTNTRVQVKMTSSYRAVTLDQGEVYLDVMHDSKRPFVVLAGNRRITDLGTKFSVYRNQDRVQVIVQEGQVRVDTLNTSAVELPVFAGGGNIITAKGEETLVVTERSQDVSKELEWRRGMIVFDQQSLADAAAQFNRYNTKQIVVEGAARDIRIGGSFNAQNVDAFASLAQESFGLHVDRKGGQIFISK